MSNRQPYLPRSETDEQLIVEEMISGQHPEHWEECDNFVKRCVYVKAKNIPDSLHEDIVQEVMHKITKSLPQFRFESTLKTWVNIIIKRCIIDVRRKLRHEELSHVPLTDQLNESDHEGESSTTSDEISAEVAFMIKDEIRIGRAALLEYANTTSNPTRNRQIINMVIFEGKTYEEAAIAAGCSAPVVGYVVREAQSRAREMRDKP